MPVFVANGDSDPMILPRYSYLLAGLIPQAQVKIYPDAAHGFLFQHHAEFAADVGRIPGRQPVRRVTPHVNPRRQCGCCRARESASGSCGTAINT